MQTTEMKKLENQKGFTLVEIAIVLVIIGLLLGGVLKGQELIENAKVKSIGKDFENMTAAYYSFQDRKGQYPTTDSNPEFWLDLKNEGFIAGVIGTSTTTEGPSHAFDGYYYLVEGAATTALEASKNYICASHVDGEIAGNLDSKYDDGTVDDGTWRGMTDLATDPEDPTESPTAAAAVANYVEGTPVMLCREL